MPGYDVTAPGAAFSNSINDFMIKRGTLKQQEILNQLAQKKFEADQIQRQGEMDIERERLAGEKEDRKIRQDLLKSQLGDKETARLEKTKSNMRPGDIPSKDFLDDLQKLDPASAAQEFPKPQESLPGIAAVPLGRTPGLMPPQGVPPVPSADPSVRPFVGNNADRMVADKQARAQAFSADLARLDPKSPEYRQKVLQYEVEEGRPITANLTAGSAGGAATATQLASAQEHFISEFTKIQTALDTVIPKYDKVGIMLNQHTAQADADVAPLILGALVGGEGTGFRMTRAEIENTLHGRTKWEDLEATLNKWTTDPEHFTIPESQRAAMRELAIAIRKKAYDSHRLIMDARAKAVEIEDPKELLRLRVELHDKLNPPTDQSELGTSKDSGGSSGMPAVGSIFNGGKVLSIKPVPSASPGNPNPVAPAAPAGATSKPAPVRVGGQRELSEAGSTALKGREGFRGEPYQDSGTGLTIGYGMHTWKGKPVTADLRVTQPEADAEFTRQVKATYAPIVDRALRVPVTQAQYDALVSMAYNSPASAQSIIQKLNAGQPVADADFQRSATVKGTPNESLQGRRQQEAAPFR